MTTAILSLWQVADTLNPQYARGQAELLVSDMSQDEAKAALQAMGFTPSGSIAKMRRRIVQIITEQAACGDTTRTINRMFAESKSWTPQTAAPGAAS